VEANKGWCKASFEDDESFQQTDSQKQAVKQMIDQLCMNDCSGHGACTNGKIDKFLIYFIYQLKIFF
jgi:hypothetical protein